MSQAMTYVPAVARVEADENPTTQALCEHCGGAIPQALLDVAATTGLPAKCCGRTCADAWVAANVTSQGTPPGVPDGPEPEPEPPELS